MNDGVKRSDVPYRWPQTLLVPSRPPELVYLDLNHWISFSKALSGHAAGDQFKDILAECLRAKSAGVAIFPISDTIFLEVSKIGPFEQRRKLRDVIELVSGYTVVTGRTVIAAHEVEALFDDLIGPSRRPVNTMRYIDWGVMRALGLDGQIQVFDENGVDMTDEARQQFAGGPDGFDEMVEAAYLGLQRNVLAGPSPDDEPHMRSLGWDPRAAMTTARKRADEETAQAARFSADPTWRRGRIRDVVSAHECVVELRDRIREAAEDRSVSMSELFTQPEEGRRAFDSMPSFDVAVSIKTSYYQDPNHRWTVNDVHDIDALGSVLPYCDVVVSDKAVVEHVKRSGLEDRLGCTVLSRLADLPASL
jgi:hypothetical protein